MKTAIAVFCKTPGLSPVKSRLGAKIGKADAEEFYRLSVLAIDEVLEEINKRLGDRVEIYWAVAEQEALAHSMWSSHARIWTGEGSLGERIHSVYEQLLMRHNQVIIIGSDSPQITADYIIAAIEKLHQPDLEGVIGPCYDGGFVLFGSKRRIPKSIWTKVTYSREDTLDQLTALLDKSKYRYEYVPVLGDVDQYEDLALLRDDFINMGMELLPSQISLYQWVKRLLRSEILLQEESA